VQRTVGVLGVVALALAGCKKPGGSWYFTITDTLRKVAFEAMTRIVIVLALVAGLGGCKKKQPDPPAIDFRSDWKTLLDLRDGMCRCKDRVCAEDALDRLKTWSTTGAKRDYKPTDTQIKDMDRVRQELNNCMVKAMATSVDVAAPAPPPPEKPTLPATPSGTATVDQLIALARGFAPVMHPQLVISSIDAVYVDAEGKLDEEDGELGILLGPANASDDDPKRRIGAPVKKGPPPPTECLKLTWKRGGWSSAPSGCIDAGRDFGRCSVMEIWKRAIAKGAPIEAIATVQLREEKPRRWVFTIVDEPRKINIQHVLPDDCELALEKQ